MADMRSSHQLSPRMYLYSVHPLWSRPDPNNCCRGCAKEEECVDPTTNEPYDGDAIYTANSTKPAGMDIRAYCCSADDFPDDDSVAIDMSKICNAAPGSVQPHVFLYGVISAAALVASFVMNM